ncbi:MAG TPA: aminopeptidase P family protein [Steroidobacteraceae bacterium]|jgi:Xaa-Pro aminopeptidase/Xaa-Pro dipeptidase|nr:aminopeptidase P family protein [Steroidobacteraceae bacterium]
MTMEMKQMFAKEIYASRRAKLGQALKGIALFPANPPSPMNYAHNTLPYAQDGCFAYFFGIPQPDLVGALDLDSGESFLFGDDPTLDALIWLGTSTPMREWADRCGADKVLPYSALADWLGERRRGRDVHFTPPYRGELTIALAQWLDLPVQAVAGRASLTLVRAIIAQREIKAPEEIAEMEAALAVTAEMHAAAMRLARPAIMEHLVSGAVEGVARSADLHLAYPVILSASGEVLHNDRHDRRLEAGDLIVHDSGASSRLGYASDITRTLPVGGRFQARQRVCYDLVLKSQLAAIDACRPGIPYLDVHKLAARVLVEGMIAEGVFRGDADEIVESGAYALVFQTGVGHQIGLDVHDMEALGENYVGYDASVQRSELFGLRNLRMAKPLKPGMVVTVEPGLYFIPALIDHWESESRYSGTIDYARVREFIPVHGIRIEDDVLITGVGHRVLGPGIPKTATEMETALAN